MECRQAKMAKQGTPRLALQKRRCKEKLICNYLISFQLGFMPSNTKQMSCDFLFGDFGCVWTMLAGVKLEVMTPATEAPDEGCIVTDFQMPPICSPHVRPGRSGDLVASVSEQLSNVFASSGVVNMKELLISHGKAAWMAYLDIYCLDADGSLFDCALLSAIGAFSNLSLPSVSVTEDGKVIPTSGDTIQEDENKHAKVQEQRQKLMLQNIPFSLTCMLYKRHLIADPTAEEESILQTMVIVVLDSSGRLVSFYKPGDSTLASTSTVQDCIALTKFRVKELQRILEEALSDMECT